MKKTSLYIFGFILILSIGIYFRLYPFFNFRADDSSDKASLLILNQIRTDIRKQVIQNNPNLSNTEREILIKKSFDDYLPQHREQIQRNILSLNHQIAKKNPASQHFPFLLASDSFYYLDLTEQIIEHGTIGEKKGSKYFNAKMTAPLGQWEPFNAHPYIGAATYYVLHFFNPNITVMQAVSFTPLFLTIIVLITFLFINHAILRVNGLVNLISALFLILTPIFIKRSALCWFDNDAYNIFFPMSILALLFYAIQHITERRKVILAGLLFSLLFPLYTLFWHGWAFLLVILLLSLSICFSGSLIIDRNKQTSLNYALLTILFTLGTIIGVGTLFGFSQFFVLIQEAWLEMKKFSSSQISAWPNAFLTVGELNHSTFSSVISHAGGWLVALIAFGEIIITFTQTLLNLKNKQPLNYSKFYQINALTIFLCCTIYLSLGAQRFTLLCVTPFLLLFAIGLNDLWNFIIVKTPKKLNNIPHNILVRLTTMIFIAMTIVPIFIVHKNIAQLLDPIYNTTWDHAFTKIRTETPANSIINTWWPPGHFIKAMAKRRVTFDGASIGVPQSYWIASFFMSTSEDEAMGILRMINNSANRATEFLESFGIKTSMAIKILKQIVRLNKEDARTLLKNHIKDPSVIEVLLQMTHNQPAPSYCLIYKELFDNNLQFSFFSKWDFEKIELINNTPALLKKVPPPKSPEYIHFLWQLINGPYKFSGVLSEISRQKNTIFFPQQVTVDVQELTASIKSPQYGTGRPFSIFYLDANENLIEKILPTSNLQYSIGLMNNGGKWECILMDRILAKSMLLRLYYFKDKNLKFFKPFFDETDLSGRNRIVIYEVLWNPLITSPAETPKN